MGSHVKISTDYYSVIQNPSYPNCVCILREFLTVPSVLGNKMKSKTVLIRKYDDEGYPNTLLVAEAWALARLGTSKSTYMRETAERQDFLRMKADFLRGRVADPRTSEAARGAVEDYLAQIVWA
ncbi:unnamed protein product [Amoebophrya sp. A25]|nr:unnamed protein product [Amoebophrya sp. A25]|eukprot:GSA25T00027976001.1